MTVYGGNEGFVKIGSTVVAEIRNWTMTQEAVLQQVDTIGGDGYGKVKSTIKRATGTITGWRDPDNAQHAMMAPGLSVTLILGQATGKQITVPAVISTNEIDLGGVEGVGTISFNFSSNGKWT